MCDVCVSICVYMYACIHALYGICVWGGQGQLVCGSHLPAHLREGLLLFTAMA